jgi:PAS domain S-box-containing protein
VSSSTSPSDRETAQQVDAAVLAGRRDIDRFFDLSLDLMGIANAEGRFVQINPAFTDTLGYSLAEFTARPFMDFVHPDDVEATAEKFAALEASRDVVGFENRYRCKDGSYRWLLWSASALRDGLTYAVARDITARKRAEEDLHVSREQAVEASRAKWEFLSNLSHELRTPLNGLIGMIQLLRDTPLDLAQTGYVDAQEVSAEALLAVLINLLHFSTLAAGGQQLERSDVDLRPVLEEACQMLADQAHAKGLTISHSVDAGVPLAVKTDRARLLQILVNLIREAVNSTHSGEIVVHVSHRKHDQHYFSVSASGVKADSENAAKPSTALTGNELSPVREAVDGFGLAISHQLVQLMGGRIGAEPGQDGDSLLWFSADLPDANATSAAASPRAASNPLSADASTDEGLLVLLAEDEEINRVVAQALLAKLGVRAAVARNGREAVEMAGAHDYDAILMDCMMPELDGLQATREIRAAESTRHVPIIAMTALAMSGDRERCLLAGMDDYLSKPARLAALDAAIQRVMARSTTAS